MSLAPSDAHHLHTPFYAHLALLHASLVLRVVGDLTRWLPGRQWGGMLNAAAIVVFFANTAYSALRPPTR